MLPGCELFPVERLRMVTVDAVAHTTQARQFLEARAADSPVDLPTCVIKHAARPVRNREAATALPA